MTERLTTGIEQLDRALGGGVAPGSIVAVTAPPDAQSEPLLRAAMSARPALYVSTIRAAAAVRETLDRTGGHDDVDVEYIGIESPLEEIRDALDSIRPGSTVVVDAVNPLESRVSEADYLRFLNALDRGLSRTDSVGLLHCLESEPPTDHRELTLAVADVVLDVDVNTNASNLEFSLEIPRARGTTPRDRVLKLELGADIGVDTSRDIS